MRVVFTNFNGTLSTNQSPLFPSPVLLVGEEKNFSSQGKYIAINRISKIFDSKSLTETSECFNQNFTRQFIAPPGRKVIICSIFEKKKFTSPSLISKITNHCQKELENEKETHVIITISWLSQEDNNIKCEPVCDTTLSLFKINTNLSHYLHFVEEIIGEL